MGAMVTMGVSFDTSGSLNHYRQAIDGPEVQLRCSSLAWRMGYASSSIIPRDSTLADHETGLAHCRHLRSTQAINGLASRVIQFRRGVDRE